MADPDRAKLTLYVSKQLAERVRHAVAHLAGAPLFLTMGGFSEEALQAAVEKLERQHNQGQPFPAPTGRKRPGRPVSSRE